MTPSLLWLPYLANIVILLPVIGTMLFGDGPGFVFEGKADESAALRIMIGGFWAAVFIASVAGFFAPRFFLPVLMVQVIYKAFWLALFVLPMWRLEGWAAVPQGITVCFIAIVATYPFFIAWSLARA